MEAVETWTPRAPAPSTGSVWAIRVPAIRRRLKVPMRLTRTTVSKVSRPCGPCLGWTVRCAQPIPAQENEIRSGSEAASTAAWTSSSFVTSVFTNVARSPSSSTRADPFSSFRSATTTDAPRSCRARTVASPSPDAPPETIADVPWISMRRRKLLGAGSGQDGFHGSRRPGAARGRSGRAPRPHRRGAGRRVLRPDRAGPARVPPQVPEDGGRPVRLLPRVGGAVLRRRRPARGSLGGRALAPRVDPGGPPRGELRHLHGRLGDPRLRRQRLRRGVPRTLDVGPR